MKIHAAERDKSRRKKLDHQMGDGIRSEKGIGQDISAGCDKNGPEQKTEQTVSSGASGQ
jgi:hypothetical protein